MQRNRNTEEPDAGNLLVRVCGGAGGVTCRLYPETWNAERIHLESANRRRYHLAWVSDLGKGGVLVVEEWQ